MKPIKNFAYDRQSVTEGIAHIGVGNFHRAHEEFYTNLLLEYPDQRQWGICGVGLLPSDEKLIGALRSQQGEYTLTVCGRNGRDEIFRIGSLVELLWGVEAPETVFEKLAAPSIRILTLTITEGGYNIDKSTGRFILDDPDVLHDLKYPDSPHTVFGFVAAGLRRRMERTGTPLTILSCDNLQHNGNTARHAFTSFVEAQDTKLAAWVAKNVTFPNSMVDRITPSVSVDDRKRLNTVNGTDDAAPVFCEDFIQWVIEDNFIAGRPAWERVGVEFTDDVTAYENMKLSLLNASHTMLSYPAFLAGYRKVDDAMNNRSFARYLREFMDRDITPYVPAPGHTDLELYKQTLIERFGNRSVSDQLSRLCYDGVSKIPVYVMPNLAKMLRDGADLERVAFFAAAYRRYLRDGTDDKGATYTVDEPWLTDDDRRLIASEEALDFLALSPFVSVDLRTDERFAEKYRNMVAAVAEKGILPVLESIL